MNFLLITTEKEMLSDGYAMRDISRGGANDTLNYKSKGGGRSINNVYSYSYLRGRLTRPDRPAGSKALDLNHCRHPTL